MLTEAATWQRCSSCCGQQTAGRERAAASAAPAVLKRNCKMTMCRGPGSSVQSSRAMRRALGVVYRAPGAMHRALGTVCGVPGALYRAPEQCRALGAVYGASGAMQSPWNNVWTPQNKAHSPKAMCGAPGTCRQLHLGESLPSCWQAARKPLAGSSKIGQAAASEISVLSWSCTEAPKLLCVGLGRSPPAPGALQCHGGCDCCPLLPWVRLFLVVTEGMRNTDRGPRCSLPTHNLLIQLVPLQCSSFRYF